MSALMREAKSANKFGVTKQVSPANLLFYCIKKRGQSHRYRASSIRESILPHIQIPNLINQHLLHK